jgi:hypothetical protein
MSNDKRCEKSLIKLEKHRRRKSKVFKGRLILLKELLKFNSNKAAPKKKAKAAFNGLVIKLPLLKVTDFDSYFYFPVL